MTAGVAVVNGHTDQGHKLKSGMKSFQQGKKAFGSSIGADHTELRPFSSVLVSDVGGIFAGDETRKQADDSLRQVMYMSCWGPS